MVTATVCMMFIHPYKVRLLTLVCYNRQIKMLEENSSEGIKAAFHATKAAQDRTLNRTQTENLLGWNFTKQVCPTKGPKITKHFRADRKQKHQRLV